MHASFVRCSVGQSLLLVACAILGGAGLTARPQNPTAEASSHLWRPMPDDAWLQEVGQKIPTQTPVQSVAVLQGAPFCVMEGKVQKLERNRFVPSEGTPAGVTRLRTLAGALWALSDQGVFRYSGQNWVKVDNQPFTDLCVHLGKVYGATSQELFRWDGDRFINLRTEGAYASSDTTVTMEDFSQVLSEPVRLGPILRLVSYSGTLYWLRPGGLSLLEGKTVVPDPIDWGMLPSPTTRDLLSLGSRLYVATDRGLGLLRGMALTSLRGSDGLPYEDTTCLAQGFDGDVWIGTARGAIRKTGNDYHYFGTQHWLPGDYVRDIAIADHTAFIATDGGLAIIRYEPFTLLNKATWFERELDDRRFKRLGFIHKLYWGGDHAGWLREISDNDGGNTAPYLAAMSYKYAVTGDETARQQALEAFKALVWLDDITPKPGFIARAIWSVKGDQGERSTSGSGGLPAKWYPTRDGLWWWKGDTSSDEVNAHMYGVCIFHDLAAKGPEKERARQHIANISSHILQNGWVLRDMDGKPTRWGRWDPDYLLRPYGYEARGLNGMEAQTYMHAAFALTGDPKFQEGLQQLLKWRYQAYTVRQRITFPPDQIAPWDDELAFFCYHVLLRYTRDPDLRSIYLRSLERTWEILRMQQVPFYNFSYGALTGNDCEAPQAVQHLRDWSLDLVNYSFHNSHRNDLAPVRDYVPYGGGTRALSPRELEPKWGARVAIEYDGGENGKAVTPPVGWLHDYWMGRYYGFIEPPKINDPNSTALEPRSEKPQGAVPYNGPPRPLEAWEK